MEIVPESAASQKPKKSSVKKDFDKTRIKIQDLKKNEQEVQIREFLGHIGVKNAPELREHLKSLLLERIQLEPNFSLYDLSPEEVVEIRADGRYGEKKKEVRKTRKQAESVEDLVTDLKAQGFSNYEMLQKLLDAHESGEVTLLDEKYADFSVFFQELSAGQFGAKDTKRIIQTINESNVDLAAPNAFEQVIWTIYEDDKISDRTKEKIREKFKLKPIKTGDDLLDNLKTQQHRIDKHESRVHETTTAITELETSTQSLKTQLKELKEEILVESNLEKRLKLEKEYDRLETLFNEQTKELEIQKKQKVELANSAPLQTVFVRGLRTQLREGRIHIQLPKSKRSLSVPSNLGNKAIASTVNTYLVNDILTPLGLEEYFFYQSDFSGDFPHPTSIDKNILFLYRLGLVRDGQILSKTDLKRLSKMLHDFMKLEEYRMDKTKHENAEHRLLELEILTKGKVDQKKFLEMLQSIKL